MEYHFSKRKPRKCPNCGSAKIASIQYGYPIFSEELDQAMKDGKIVLGGCVITGCDPSWQCIDCDTLIYKDEFREYPKEINNEVPL